MSGWFPDPTCVNGVSGSSGGGFRPTLDRVSRLGYSTKIFLTTPLFSLFLVTDRGGGLMKK